MILTVEVHPLLRISSFIARFDVDGACANAVKDSQRTKTSDTTTTTLTVIWGLAENAPLLSESASWYQDILRSLGASIESVGIEAG